MSVDRQAGVRTVRSSIRFVGVFLVACSVLGGFAVGPAGAAESAPGEPASFFGSATDTNGDPIPENETIVGVVDGKPLDSIAIDQSGTYGGDAVFDDKLRVDSEAGDAIVFRLADREGPIGRTIELEPGVFETDLTFSSEAIAYVRPDVAIDAGATELPPGEEIHLSGAESTPYDDTELVAYEWSVERGGEVIETFAGETATYRFEENGTYNLTLELTDGKNRTNATTETFDVSPEFAGTFKTDDSGGSGGGATTAGGGASAGGSTGGGGASGGSSGGDTSSTETPTPTNTVDSTEEFDPAGDPIAEQTVRIDDTFPDVPGTTVGFDRSAVTEILFEDDDMSGDIIVREFDSVSDDAPPLPEELRVVSAVVLTVPSEHRETPALIRSMVDPDRLKTNNIVPRKLAIYRLPGGADRWQELSTETFETHEGVVVEAETPGFSQFVIAAPETPALLAEDSPPEKDSQQQTTDREPDSTTDSEETAANEDAVGFARPIGALVAFLVIVGTVGRILIPRRRGR
jgi:PGF-pre-PGF domain-containing protein